MTSKTTETRPEALQLTTCFTSLWNICTLRLFACLTRNSSFQHLRMLSQPVFSGSRQVPQPCKCGTTSLIRSTLYGILVRCHNTSSALADRKHRRKHIFQSLKDRQTAFRAPIWLNGTLTMQRSLPPAFTHHREGIYMLQSSQKDLYFTRLHVLRYVCPHAGLTGTYAYLYTYGGPVSMIWGWILVSTANLIVALSMSEICSAYPTSGGVYFWSHRLAGRKRSGEVEIRRLI